MIWFGVWWLSTGISCWSYIYLLHPYPHSSTPLPFSHLSPSAPLPLLSTPQSCIEGQISEGLMCVAIVCNIFQLPGTGSAEVTVEAYLDERYFSVSLQLKWIETNAQSLNRTWILYYVYICGLLVFLATGGMAPAATIAYKRLAYPCINRHLALFLR